MVSGGRVFFSHPWVAGTQSSPPRRGVWETDFYTPPVLGDAALSDNSRRAVYKIQGPQGTGFLYTAGAELSKRAGPPSTAGA